MRKGWLTLILAVLMTVSLCACGERTVDDPKGTPSPKPTETATLELGSEDCGLTELDEENLCAHAAYEAFLAGDMSLLEPVEPGWAEHLALIIKAAMEYTYLDLDGDGVDELLLQCPNDPMSYNGVFHYRDGLLQCWQHDEVEMSCRDYPLRDGIMVQQYRESYHLFRYQPDGSKKELTGLDAMLRRPDEAVYFYSIDGEDVDRAEFERQLKHLVTDQLLERKAWTEIETVLEQ